jgi:hypothetical protein
MFLSHRQSWHVVLINELSYDHQGTHGTRQPREMPPRAVHDKILRHLLVGAGGMRISAFARLTSTTVPL